ncbi:MAG: phosphoribosylformylglycinamidine synthase [Clostridia bacterium]
MVYRVYVEKKPGFDHEAQALLSDIRRFLRIDSLTDLRIINRYDVEDIDEALFAACVTTVFSEPPLDVVREHLPDFDGQIFACEYLPGQFDQRADSAAQCVQLSAQCERPTVRTAQVFLLTGDISPEEMQAIKRRVINPVERREAALDRPETLKQAYELPEEVEQVSGFILLSPDQRAELIEKYRFAMDEADVAFCQRYFAQEGRDPTLTEMRMIDTYWSDHCRHTTFSTHLTQVSFEDADVQKAYERYQAVRSEIKRTQKPVTLMDLATIGQKVLVARGQLKDLDESEEINACTVKVDVEVDGEKQKWLLLFKNETHNHPTEIEPFGGAATCIGGAIRDPLSGRAYVYQAMRVTGAADPTRPIGETLPGKLPQRQLVTTAANGYSAYGNQIGLATGLVDEIYHDGYAAKRMEIGAVVGAAPEENVRREVPVPGDVVVLLGGRTGRDGCGGATGSSKKHTRASLTLCGAEVQKGNAPEERKLQRLFRNPEASRLIKRCNDFGAGGVSVAIGELADGLAIDLNKVPRKYEGLDGTELAISESQERMAVVLAPEDVERFLAIAHAENLEATRVAVVTKEKRLVMRWNGSVIVDIARDFLNSNGASKQAAAHVEAQRAFVPECPKNLEEGLKALVSSLNVCSRRGLCERFDSTNGASSLLMPFGGRRQLTPTQAMASLIPVEGKESRTCSAMAYGFNPYVSEKSPYRGAYLAVVESMAKLCATGAGRKNAHLTLQEYFERMTGAENVWGKPLAALLGALDAQLDLGVAAIGGKDSMSGSFEQIHVPPTLVSFAVTTCPSGDICANEFKKADSPVARWLPAYRENGLPEPESLKALFDEVTQGLHAGTILSAWAIGAGGAAEALFKMGLGNRLGVELKQPVDLEALFGHRYGGFIVEYARDENTHGVIGHTSESYALSGVSMDALEKLYEGKLDKVFPATVENVYDAPKTYRSDVRSGCAPRVKVAKPRVLIPAFPGTNCEYDTEKVFLEAGAQPVIAVIRNLSSVDVAQSVEEFARLLKSSQILFLPGGFSGGDEPDGSAKFITAFLRNPRIKDQVLELLNHRDGLIGGICNGFQALIKLGLVPYGEFREPTPDAPTLTFNHIARHQSRLVRTRVSSTKPIWLNYAQLGDIHTAPVSHGEGRFVASAELIRALSQNGQIATQYVGEDGRVTMDVRANPNGSVDAIEGICSPDGRVFGKMAHAERVGKQLYKNVPGNYDNGMFRAATDYFRL